MNHIKAQFSSFYGLSRCRFLSAVLMLILASAHGTEAQKARLTEVESIEARRLFYSKEFGKVAFLPDARTETDAKNAGVFWGLQHACRYSIKPRSQPCWFQFNHKLPQSNGKRRHVGILIITINSTGSEKMVEAYRNKNWHRPEDGKELGLFFKTASLSWDKFDSLITKSAIDDADVEITDKVLGGPWHAVPNGGDKFSWEYRKFWRWALDEFKRELPVAVTNTAALKFRVSTRLIGFSPTQKVDSQYPVLFDSQHRSGDMVFIAAYSLTDSGQDVRNWSWIKIK